MSDLVDEEQKRAMIGSLRDADVIVPPLYVETQGKIVENALDEVVAECAFALVKGEDLTANATSWGEVRDARIDNIMAMQLMILAIEDKTLGSIYINLPHSPLYLQTVRAIAKRYVPKKHLLKDKFSKADAELIKQHVQPSSYFHKQQLREIVNAIKKLEEEINAEKSSSNKEGPGESLEGEEHEQQDAFQDEEEERVAPVVEWTLEDEFAARSVRREVFFVRVVAPHATDVGAVTGPIPIPAGPSDILPKALLTVAPIPHRQNAELIVGYLVRILVHDMAWNPGKIIYDLMQQIMIRKKNIGNAYFRDPWPQYRHLFGTNFPVFSFSMGRWLDFVNSTTGERPDFLRRMVQHGQADRADDRTSRAHPFAVCSLRRAIQRLEAAGGNVGSACSLDYDANRATWSTHLAVYRYQPSQVCWSSEDDIGLTSQTFPGARHSTFLTPELERLLKNRDYVQQSEVRALMPNTLPYRTNNPLVLLNVEARGVYKKIMTGRGGLPDPARLREAVKIGIARLCTLCVPAGNAEVVGLPVTVRKINEYLHNIETVTREAGRYDPKMSIFNNMLARFVLSFEKYRGICQPSLILKMLGLFSVYQPRWGQLLYNIIIYSTHGTGKSYIMDFFQALCIQGTFSSISRTTKAADQTDVGVHDEIRGYQEIEEFIVSNKAAKRDPDRANMKKDALTSGIITLRTFESVALPGYGKVRSARVVTSAQNYTDSGCSNWPPDSGALGSRYHCHFLIPTDVADMPFKKGSTMAFELEHESIVEQFRIMQALICWTEKAMGIMAMDCMQPFMGLFNHISHRMVDALRTWGYISGKNVVWRNFDIMEQMARVLVIMKMIMLLFNVRGVSPHYGKAFHPSMLRDGSPFLYCDQETTLFVWTLHVSDWIKTEFEIVLSAMCKLVLHEQYDAEKDPYYYYVRDYDNKICFKKDKNHAWTSDQGRANMYYLDLNYFQINGNGLGEIARAISEHTNPRLDADDVEEMLRRMSKESFTPQLENQGMRNGYNKHVFSDELVKHKYTREPVTRLTSDYTNELRKMASRVHEVFFEPLCRRYTVRNIVTVEEARKEFISVSHIQIITLALTDVQWTTLGDIAKVEREGRLPEAAQQRIARAISDGRFAVTEILENVPYSDQLVLLYFLDEGWISTPDNPKTHVLKPAIIREGPFPHYASQNDISQLNNLPVGMSGSHAISLVDISNSRRVCFSPMALRLFDKNVIIEAFEFATTCKTTRPGKRLLGWVDDRSASKFSTVTYTREEINDKVRALDAVAPANAVMRAQGIPFRRAEYIEEESREMLYGFYEKSEADHSACLVEVVPDLDRWAAEQQHRICGLGTDEPVRDPAWIDAHYEGPVGTTDYPKNIIDEYLRKKTRDVDPNAASMASRNVLKRSSRR